MRSHQETNWIRGLRSPFSCIVAGNAACLHDDLKKVGELLEKADDLPIIAVNGASKEVKAFALYSQHPDRFISLGWIKNQKKIHADFTIHSSCKHECVNYVWDIKNSGGSAWGARKVASLMGFDQVILCGCPMEAGPYVGNHNLGGLMHKKNVVDELFRQIEADSEWHKGCISMSGRTRELLC